MEWHENQSRTSLANGQKLGDGHCIPNEFNYNRLEYFYYEDDKHFFLRYLKGLVSPDFTALVFFHSMTTSIPLIQTSKPFRRLGLETRGISFFNRGHSLWYYEKNDFSVACRMCYHRHERFMKCRIKLCSLTGFDLMIMYIYRLHMQPNTPRTVNKNIY
jgi:hypothetical protein